MTEKKPGEPDERDKQAFLQAFLDIRAAWQRGGLDPGFTAVARYREEIESRALADAKRFTTLTEYEEELEKARREGFEAGESLMHAHCLADEINQHRSEWKQEGAREALERAARLLEQPAMVFAFEAESIREDVIKRIRTLADQPEAEGKENPLYACNKCGYCGPLEIHPRYLGTDNCNYRAFLIPPQPPAKADAPGTCQLCGKPMPRGEEMFKYHGYSGPCPEPEAAHGRKK